MIEIERVINRISLRKELTKHVPRETMINRSPWLWGARKTAAGMTGRTSLGIQILQGKRAKGQSNPSPEFIQAQAAGRIITGIFQRIASVINKGFLQVGPGQSPYNLFYRWTYDNAIDLSAPPDATLEPADLLISKGVMTQTPFSSTPTAVASTHLVHVAWPSTIVDDTQSADDVVNVAIYNATQDKWFPASGGFTRTTGPEDIDVGAGFMAATNVIHVYMGFYGQPGEALAGTSSNSVHASIVAS